MSHVLDEIGRHDARRPNDLPAGRDERLMSADLDRLRPVQLIRRVRRRGTHVRDEQSLLTVDGDRLHRLHHLEHSVAGVLQQLAAVLSPGKREHFRQVRCSRAEGGATHLDELLRDALQVLQVEDLRLHLRRHVQTLLLDRRRLLVVRRRHLHRLAIGRGDRLDLLRQEVLQLLQRDHLRLVRLHVVVLLVLVVHRLLLHGLRVLRLRLGLRLLAIVSELAAGARLRSRHDRSIQLIALKLQVNVSRDRSSSGAIS